MGGFLILLIVPSFYQYIPLSFPIKKKKKIRRVFYFLRTEKAINSNGDMGMTAVYILRKIAMQVSCYGEGFACSPLRYYSN